MNKKQDIIRGYLNCTCDEAYKSRRLTDPDCFLCEYESEIELMMQEYHEEQLKIQNIPAVSVSLREDAFIQIKANSLTKQIWGTEHMECFENLELEMQKIVKDLITIKL